jgi:aryl-alcohol dehydrogenase-like predicted oxidoreductase
VERRVLGNSGLEVSSLAFGGSVLGWTVEKTAAFDLLDAYAANGGNFIDTADSHCAWMPGSAGGESESTTGEWPTRSGLRSRMVIATKVGMHAGCGQGLSQSHIRRAAESSLRRLRTDFIDLYQSHVDDPQTTSHETIEGYAELQKQGKIRARGASNFSIERLSCTLRLSRELRFTTYKSY